MIRYYVIFGRHDEQNRKLMDANSKCSVDGTDKADANSQAVHADAWGDKILRYILT
jgi:hypothetical protein